MSEILDSLKSYFKELAYEDFIEGVQLQFSSCLLFNLKLLLEHTVPPSNLITFSIFDINLNREIIFKVYNNTKSNNSMPKTLEELAQDIEKELILINKGK